MSDSIHWVTTGLHEHDILRPCNITAIAESPLFRESLTGLHLILVAQTLLHETSLVTRSRFILLVRRLIVIAEIRAHLFALTLIDRGHALALDISYRLVLVLANKSNGSVTRFSDLQHGVFEVDTLSLALLAKIVVLAHRTHVSDT